MITSELIRDQLINWIKAFLPNSVHTLGTTNHKMSREQRLCFLYFKFKIEDKKIWSLPRTAL